MVRQAVTLVGRDAECHLCLPDDDQVAPRHARFEERGTGVFLTGLSSDHPVQCNGTVVEESLRLTHNDEIRIGQTLVQFQDVIAPHAAVRQSPGLLQPSTLLMTGAILLLEIALLVFLVNWPHHLILPETEAADKTFAEKLQAEREAEKEAKSNATSQAQSPISVVSLPGSLTEAELSAPATDAPEAALPKPVAPDAIDNPPLNPSAAVAAPDSPPAAVLEVLEEANFEAADTNTVLVELPPISKTDPRIEDAQRMLAEANAAAQFSDYAKANRLLNQIHQAVPGFVPAHVEHARLLEARGDVDGAQQRWSQILGIADPDSPFYSLATRERERLNRIQALQTQSLQTPQPSSLSSLPRHIRIESPRIQKMPADSDVVEMRVLTATLNRPSKAPIFKEAAIQAFITFYDIDPDGEVSPTRAITTPSPLALGPAFSNRQSLPVEATYVVPRGLRPQEERETGQRSSYYGYTIHVFAGQILQDAKGKPKKLLKLPIQLPRDNTPPPS